MNNIASLPYWFDEDVVAAKLYAKIELSQEELDVLVWHYMNYNHNDDGFWNALITFKGIRYKIPYRRVLADNASYYYEQPEVLT